MNKRALMISIFFIVIETLIIATIFYLLYYTKPSEEILKHLLEIIPTYFITLATTIYVVFTYYLMFSTVKSHSILHEPLISFRWRFNTEAKNFRFSKMDELKKKIMDYVNVQNTIVSELKSKKTEVPMGYDAKHFDRLKYSLYLQLDIANERDIDLNWLQFKLDIGIRSMHAYRFGYILRLEEEFNFKDFELIKDKKIEITITEINYNPNYLYIDCHLKSIKYGSSKLNYEISEYSGSVNYFESLNRLDRAN